MRIPRVNDEKDYRRPPLNPNTFKKTNFGEVNSFAGVFSPTCESLQTSTNNIIGTPPKHGSFRGPKPRSATGAHLPGMMRTGRTMENDDMNLTAATGRGQQKSDASPQLPRRTIGLHTRSPSPARRPVQTNGGVQQQKTRPSIGSAGAKHCHQCGEQFPVERAKFCSECGEQRSYS